MRSGTRAALCRVSPRVWFLRMYAYLLSIAAHLQQRLSACDFLQPHVQHALLACDTLQQHFLSV